MWKLYAIGFAVMAAFMIVAGVALVVITLANPSAGGTPEADWLARAGVAVVLGLFAATLATLAWRQSRRAA